MKNKTDPAEPTTISSSQRQDRERLLTRTTLLRKVYRVLLNTGRSYAAFTEKERDLLQSFRNKKEIFDPMSGYGSLTRYCAERGLKSYCVEYNLPQYLWQLLCHPKHSIKYIESSQLMLSWKKRWPSERLRARSSDEWFPPESTRLLLGLLDLASRATKASFGVSGDERGYLTVALLLPFVGRLSCSVPGDIVTHVKKGGICVYVGWEYDFELYLKALISNLERIKKASSCTAHTLIHADAGTFRFS